MKDAIFRSATIESVQLSLEEPFHGDSLMAHTTTRN
jgi:hypothetical protein